MKSKSLLTAGPVILLCSCVFAGIYNYRPVNYDEGNRSATYRSSPEKKEMDEEQAEFIIWKSIPGYLLIFNR
jgi:hypothetical protein